MLFSLNFWFLFSDKKNKLFSTQNKVKSFFKRKNILQLIINRSSFRLKIFSKIILKNSTVIARFASVNLHSMQKNNFSEANYNKKKLTKAHTKKEEGMKNEKGNCRLIEIMEAHPSTSYLDYTQQFHLCLEKIHSKVYWFVYFQRSAVISLKKITILKETRIFVVHQYTAPKKKYTQFNFFFSQLCVLSTEIKLKKK